MKIIRLILLFTLYSSILSVNAQTWSAIGLGLNYNVFAISNYNGNIYSGGFFFESGGIYVNGISMWNGTFWDSLSSGMTGYNPSSYPEVGVFALAVYSGNLIAGGQFYSAGGKHALYIAEWNGTNWDSLSTGLGTGMYSLNYVDAFALYNGNLYVGGDFNTAGGNTANNIASWNGASWFVPGKGTNNYIYALCIYNGKLIAAGSFDSAGGYPANNIAEWNDTSWSPLSSGFNGAVDALSVYDGELYAGGTFDSAGGNTIYNIARWNGSSWNSAGGKMSLTEGIFTLTSYNGYLYAGGYFDTIGGIAANSIAFWNGSLWQAMGKGINGDVFTIYGDFNTIYAGGRFDSAGGIYAMNIAMYSNPFGIKGIDSNPEKISLFPNPNTGKFTISYSSIQNLSSNLEIYNVLGERVETQCIASLQTTVDLQGKSPGVYFYRVISEDGSLVGEGKFLIER